MIHVTQKSKFNLINFTFLQKKKIINLNKKDTNKTTTNRQIIVKQKEKTK